MLGTERDGERRASACAVAGKGTRVASAPGWYADPTGRHEYRYWTGDEWTGRVADSDGPLVNPSEALAEATFASDLLPDRVPPGRPPVSSPRRPGRSSGGKRRRRPRVSLPMVVGGVLALLVAATAAIWFLPVDDDPQEAGPSGSSDDGGGGGGGGESPGESAGGDDRLLEALRTYVVTTSNGAVDDAGASCMAESIIDTVGLERLEEVGVDTGADPLVALARDEVQTGLPAAMDCLDDTTVEGLIAATLKPTVLVQLGAESPQCLVTGWMDGLGRDKLTELYALWASGGSSALTAVLDAEQLGVLGAVISQCKTPG